MEQDRDFYLSKKLLRNSDIISTAVDSDLVLMSTSQGKYYGVSIVGQRIWELLQDSMIGNDLVEILVTEFTVERSVCEAEVTTFLKQLHEEGLVEVN